MATFLALASSSLLTMPCDLVQATWTRTLPNSSYVIAVAGADSQFVEVRTLTGGRSLRVYGQRIRILAAGGRDSNTLSSPAAERSPVAVLWATGGACQSEPREAAMFLPPRDTVFFEVGVRPRDAAEAPMVLEVNPSVQMHVYVPRHLPATCRDVPPLTAFEYRDLYRMLPSFSEWLRDKPGTLAKFKQRLQPHQRLGHRWPTTFVLHRLEKWPSSDVC